jgi:CHAT domain-containing protein
MAIKARIQAKLGRRAEAESLYAKGMDILDALLTHVPTPEVERLLLTELGNLYSGFFELLSDDGRYDDAFRVIEQAHGRIEAQELEYDHIEVPHKLSAEEKQLQELELELVNTDDQGKRADILDQIRSSQENGVIDRTDEKTATLMELRRQLQPDDLLIEYVLASPRSYALVINRLGARRYALLDKKEIEEEVARYRNILRKYGTNSQLGQQLFQNLLGFTRSYPEAKSLLIVADGTLHLLPFSALIDESGKYLLETKPVGMTPSGTVLALLHDRVDTTSKSRPYLGVAAWTKPGETKPWVLRTISAESKPGELAILPQSRDEVESIAAMMPQPATVLIGQEATKQRFESLPLSDYRILHLALHGLVDPVFPDRSALAFAPSKNDNGRLEARDIRKLHLNAELVTLSACDTGVGPVGAAGIESIDTAFIEAGASSVVSTLWELEDRTTNRLMKAFYGRLSRENKIDALRDAKLDLLRAGLQPYYWASYEIVGDPRGGLFASK